MEKNNTQTGEVRITRRVSLQKNNAAEYVPNEAATYHEAGGVLEQLAIAVQNNKPVLLIGETGTGKTSVIRYLAKQTGNGFRRLNLNGGTTVEDVIGKTLLNKEGTFWLDGVLVEAMRKGYWCLIDEINAANAEVLFKLYSLLDDDRYIVLEEKNGEIVKPHADFRLFATMNPSADYVGTRELNKALLSRFYAVKIDFPAPEVEKKILQERAGITGKIAEQLVKFGQAVRKMKREDKISFVLSTRELLQWAELVKIYKKYIPAAEVSILNKLHDSEITAVKDLLTLQFKKTDGIKTESVAEPLKIGDKVEMAVQGSYIHTGLGSRGIIEGINAAGTIAAVKFTEYKNWSSKSKEEEREKMIKSGTIWDIPLDELKKI